MAEGTASLPADTTTVDAGELRRFAALRDKVAIALHDAECGDRHCEPQAMGAYYRQADIALAAAGPVIAAEAARRERQRIYAELGNEHYAIFTEDRWTVEHSVECRLSGRMHECDYHAAVALIADEYEPEMLGRWCIDSIDSEGMPGFTRADLLEGDAP